MGKLWTEGRNGEQRKGEAVKTKKAHPAKTSLGTQPDMAAHAAHPIPICPVAPPHTPGGSLVPRSR